MELIFGKGERDTEELQKYFSHIPGTIELNEIKADLIVAQEELIKYVGEPIIRRAVDHYKSDFYLSETAEEVSELPEKGWGEQTVVYPEIPEPEEELPEEELPEGEGEEEGIEDGQDGVEIPVYEYPEGELTQPQRFYLLDRLVEHIQNAVTLLGYREYALNNDATHTKTGRMARMDKDTDEWTDKLIDRDDFALQRKGQKAITRLIKFVSRWLFPDYLAAEPYSSTKDLYLWNSEKFHKFHPIDHDDRLFMLMLPMNRSVQQDFIDPVIEPARRAEILKWAHTGLVDVAEGEDGDQKRAAMRNLYDKIGYAIAYLALSKGYKELPVQLFPESISRNFWAAGNGAAFIAFRDKIAGDTRNEGMRKLNVLMMYLEEIRAAETQTAITDEDIMTIDKRMKAENKFARV
jgi:hypothetical protein